MSLNLKKTAVLFGALSLAACGSPTSSHFSVPNMGEVANHQKVESENYTITLQTDSGIDSDCIVSQTYHLSLYKTLPGDISYE